MKAIAAMSLNRVIGNKGEIPWRIPDDLKYFRKVTTDRENGRHLIMGHTTFQQVGVLPERFIYVLTNDLNKRSLSPRNTHRYVNYDDLTSLPVPWNNIWVCGGSQIYNLFLPQCNAVYLTIVFDEYEGDTFMPEFEDKFPNQEIIKEAKNYWTVRYWRQL
jgi:dihydrofolate reductase